MGAGLSKGREDFRVEVGRDIGDEMKLFPCKGKEIRGGRSSGDALDLRQ
jgi:hypothetical protein